MGGVLMRTAVYYLGFLLGAVYLMVFIEHFGGIASFKRASGLIASWAWIVRHSLKVIMRIDYTPVDLCSSN